MLPIVVLTVFVISFITLIILDSHFTRELIGVNRNTVDRFCFALRTIIAEEIEKAASLHEEAEKEVEADESYFGGKRKDKDKRVRWTASRCGASTEGITKSFTVSC